MARGGDDGTAMTGLGSFLTKMAELHGTKPALVLDGRRLGFAALDVMSRRVAGGLARLGIGRGDRVAFWLPNVPAYLVLFFACARLGAAAVAVNTRFRSSEVGDIVGRSGAKALVLWPDFHAIRFLEILAAVDPAALARIETVVLYGTAAGALPNLPLPAARRVAYGALAEVPPLEGEGAGGLDDGAAIFTTSGTTKAPKLVLHRQRSLLDHALKVAPGFGFDRPGTVLFQAVPYCGVFGFSQALAALAAGAPSHLMPAFEAEPAAELLRREAVTQTNGADDMFRRLLVATPEARPFPAMRAAGFAAFTSDPRVMVDEADARGLTLVGLYGMSEVQALLAHQPEAASPAARARPGGVCVDPATVVRARDPDTGAVLPPGQSGELEISGPSLMAGYDGNPEATAAAFTEDGFFRTGDLGFVDPAGGFVFETRMGDVLRLGGFLVSPAEIEAHLQAHPCVDTAQVVGVTTATGPRAAGFVTLKPGAGFDEAVLRDWCRASLAGFKVPVRIIRLDEFPATQSANGVKIQRARLRDMAAAALAGVTA